MCLDNIKIALLKGAKGDTGRTPTTKEIQDAIADNPSILVDLTTVANATTEWLDENGMIVGNETITTDMIRLGAVKTEQIGEKAVTPAKLDREYALSSEERANACDTTDVTHYSMGELMESYTLGTDYDGYMRVTINKGGTPYSSGAVDIIVWMLGETYDNGADVKIGTLYADTAKTVMDSWFVKKGTSITIEKDTGISVEVDFYPFKFVRS